MVELSCDGISDLSFSTATNLSSDWLNIFEKVVESVSSEYLNQSSCFELYDEDDMIKNRTRRYLQGQGPLRPPQPLPAAAVKHSRLKRRRKVSYNCTSEDI